jgi:hypothetical protein
MNERFRELAMLIMAGLAIISLTGIVASAWYAIPMPYTPSELNQNKSDGITVIAVGDTINEGTVTFSAKVDGSEYDDYDIKLQIELRKIDENGGEFNWQQYWEQGKLKESAFVPKGSIATVTVTNLEDGSYHWQAGAENEIGFGSFLQDFGDNPLSSADFVVSTISTPPPTPLVAVINEPDNNFYSEKEVSFRGTASGGTPPYTFTWTSDKDGMLRMFGTTETFDEFSMILSPMGRRVITLKVEDSSGQTATFEGEMNVVEQKIKMLVVPITNRNSISPEEQTKINQLVSDTKEYYLESSYGAIYFDVSFNEGISTSVNLLNSDAVARDVLTKLDTAIQSQYSTIVIANTGGDTERGFSSPLGKIRGLMGNQQLMYPKTITIVPVSDNARLGTWAHEIGHALGYTVETSETIETIETNGKLGNVLWSGTATSLDCFELYNCGNVEAWDIMAKGEFVYNSKEDSKVNQPTDMSILSKIKLGWLIKEPIAILEGDYSITSMENMRYKDQALVFNSPWSSSAEYYIEARELKQPSYYQWAPDANSWLGWNDLNNGILIYKVTHDSNNKYSINILRSSFDLWGGPTFKASDGISAEYSDPSEFVRFKVVESNTNHPYNAKISISRCVWCNSIEGFTMDAIIPFLESIGFLSNPVLGATTPDLDLHAYTPDGKHVGMNYTSGEYEMQIPNSYSSGDMIGGKEWMFFPTGTEVRYYVSSHDVQKFLEENSDVNPANWTLTYSTSFMEYGENPQAVQLSDGSWTIADRTVSLPVQHTIGPGTISEIQLYNFGGILQPINQDGSSVFKLGRTVPVKFQLRNTVGDFASTAIAKIYLAKTSNSVTGTETEAESTSSATTGNLFRYDITENQYIFNLATKPLTTGTWQIRIELDDGTSKYVNIGLK